MTENEAQIPKLIPLLRRHFFAGLLVLLPLLVIIWILAKVLNLLWRINEVLPAAWQPANLFANGTLVSLIEFGIGLAATFLMAFGISLLGWSSQRYLGKKLLEVISYLIKRIPVIRSIYSGLDQFGKTIAAGGGKQFSRVVYIEYPRRDCWSIAFVTGPAKFSDKSGTSARYLNVYVPTTPNPTSGFHLIIPESEVRESALSVEEAFKTIISLGIAQS